MDAIDSLDRNREGMNPRLLWLLPLAFVVHDAEELAIMPAWLSEHRAALSGLLQGMPAMGDGSLLLHLDTGGIALAMGAILLLFVAVTAAAVSSAYKIALYAYALVLGGFFVHGFGHIGQALVWRGYTPGVVTALLVVIPASVFLYARLWRSRMLGPAESVLLTAAGAALVVPAILLALSIGRRFGG